MFWIVKDCHNTWFMQASDLTFALYTSWYECLIRIGAGTTCMNCFVGTSVKVLYHPGHGNPGSYFIATGQAEFLEDISPLIQEASSFLADFGSSRYL